MRRGLRLCLGLLALIAAAAALTGCATRTSVIREPGAAQFAPTDPTRIQLIPWAPVRSYQRLGEIVVVPGADATTGDVKLLLDDAAARLGAHALYVVHDPTQRFALVQVDVHADDAREHYPANGIVAVAIRYQ